MEFHRLLNDAANAASAPLHAQRESAGVIGSAVKAAVETLTVRFETAPGEQMQIDFGEKRVVIAGVEVVVHLMVAVLTRGASS